MEDNICFESEIAMDLTTYKEFTKLTTEAHSRNTVSRFITVLCVAYLLFNLPTSRVYVIGFLLLSLFYIVVHLIQYFTSRDGGLGYKQMQYAARGSVPRKTVTCTSAGITSTNAGTDVQSFDPLENIKYVFESKNLLVLITNIKMCHIIDKRTLTGGTREELIAFLRSSCPNMKKKVKTGKLGRFMTRTMWALVIIGCIAAVCTLLQIPERLSGRLTNDMTYREMAAELAELDIIISDQTIEELESYDADYAAEYGDYYDINRDASKIYDLLYWEGSGVYDEVSWEWTPSTSGVYWFDLEVYSVNTIYTDFLTGVDAMSESITFTNIHEDYSGVDLDGGTGEVLVSFTYEGQNYEFTADYDYDWFDMEMLSSVVAVLAADQDSRELWFASDGGQGLLLYYGTEEQMRQLKAKSGLDFYQ